MEFQRLVLLIVFSFSLFMLVERWQQDQHPAPPKIAASGEQQKDATVPPVPTDKLAAPAATPVPQTGAMPQAPQGALAAGTPIVVDTDLVHAEISTAGGDLRRLELKQHRDIENKGNFVLFEQ